MNGEKREESLLALYLFIHLSFTSITTVVFKAGLFKELRLSISAFSQVSLWLFVSCQSTVWLSALHQVNPETSLMVCVQRRQVEHMLLKMSC